MSTTYIIENDSERKKSLAMNNVIHWMMMNTTGSYIKAGMATTINDQICWTENHRSHIHVKCWQAIAS